MASILHAAPPPPAPPTPPPPSPPPAPAPAAPRSVRQEPPRTPHLVPRPRHAPRCSRPDERARLGTESAPSPPSTASASSIRNGILSIRNGILSIRNGILSIRNGTLSIRNGAPHRAQLRIDTRERSPTAFSVAREDLPQPASSPEAGPLGVAAGEKRRAHLNALVRPPRVLGAISCAAPSPRQLRADGMAPETPSGCGCWVARAARWRAGRQRDWSRACRGWSRS